MIRELALEILWCGTENVDLDHLTENELQEVFALVAQARRGEINLYSCIEE